MHPSIILSWLVLLAILLPIFFSGIIILRKTTLITRIELLLPAGIVLGLTIFTFILNTTAFVFKGPLGVTISYGLMLILGILFIKYKDLEIKQIEFLTGKRLLFWIISILAWGGLVFWKSAFALIGSDTNLYYAIAATFIKGNFPALTPWQPDLPLAYHLGAFELLGSFHLFTQLSFEFLHLFFSGLFIFCAIQIVIWIWGSTQSLVVFCLINLMAGAIFISFGFFYLVFLNSSVVFPQIGSFQEMFLWLRNLPTVAQAIEVYGAPINLDSLIYFIFHSFGLVIFLTMLIIILHPKQKNRLLSWFVISICLSSLAIINESIFIAVVGAVILGITLTEIKNHSLIKNSLQLISISIFLFLTVLFQGGVISATLLERSELNKSVILFPKKEDIKEVFTDYHMGQQISRILPQERKWLPFSWYHVGLDILITASFILIVWLKIESQKRLLLIMLFLSGIFSLFAYHFVVPKYLIANGNRFLSASFLFFSLLLSFSLIYIWEKINKDFAKKVIFLTLVMWIFVPTILPPLALLSKTRFGENKLAPKTLESSPAIHWLKNNISFSEKVMVLDKNAPHPSGQTRALVEAGVFAPVFSGNYRAFTIEASPEYIDIAYTLSPQALSKLKISTILIDNFFYQTLPLKRRNQLDNEKYFSKVFDDSYNQNRWERVYKVKDGYLKNGEELNGNLESLLEILPRQQERIYIDNEENFKYDYLRRPIIFMLRNRDLYFNPQSGVYLNVEASINQKNPQKDFKYDFLILGNTTDPSSICQCNLELIWKGLNDQVFLWRSEYFGKVEK